MPRSVVFADGFTVTTGKTVKVSSKYGTTGEGVVIEIVEKHPVRVKIAMRPGTQFAARDRWSLGDRFYDRIKENGVYGGEIVRA